MKGRWTRVQFPAAPRKTAGQPVDFYRMTCRQHFGQHIIDRVASIRTRYRGNGSPYFSVLYRLDGSRPTGRVAGPHQPAGFLDSPNYEPQRQRIRSRLSNQA